MEKVKLIFTPSGPGHVFHALIGSGYVHCDSPGPIEVDEDQAAILTLTYPKNFAEPEPEPEKEEKEKTEKAADGPGADKAMRGPEKNKGRRRRGGG